MIGGPSSRLTDLLRRRFGLVVGGPSLEALSKFLDSLARSGPERQLAVARLENAGLDDPVLRDLLAVATTGETCFFRDLRQWEAIRQALRLRARLSQPPLHAWCAGCSTGEEPLTLAIVAAQERIPIKIVGTDVCPDAIAAARQGVYRDWALRRTPEGIRASYFVRQEDDLWRVKDEVRENVLYSVENLLAPRIVSLPAFDLALCRNVFIYFDEASAEQAIGQLERRLVPGGFLFLGCAESVAAPRPGLDNVPLSTGLALRKGNAPESSGKSIARSQKAAGPRSPTPDDLEARYRAALLERKGGNTRGYEHQLNEILRESPGFWPAAFLLARLKSEQGRLHESRHEFGRVLQILDGESPNAAVPDAIARHMESFIPDILRLSRAGSEPPTNVSP